MSGAVISFLHFPAVFEIRVTLALGRSGPVYTQTYSGSSRSGFWVALIPFFDSPSLSSSSLSLSLIPSNCVGLFLVAGPMCSCSLTVLAARYSCRTP